MPGENTSFEEEFAKLTSAEAPQGPSDADLGEQQNLEVPQSGADAPDPATGAEQAPTPEAAPDPWANASPELIAERERLKQELEAVRHSDHSQRGRIAALQRQLNATKAPAPQQPGQAEEPGTSPAKAALDEKIKQLKEEYPDVAGPLIEMIQAQREEFNAVKTDLSGLSEERQQAEIARQYQALEARHSDWRTVIADPNYQGWLQAQPAAVQKLADSWDAQESSVALTLFKTERAEAMQAAGGNNAAGSPAIDAKRSRQLDGSRAVGSRPAPAASGAPDDFDAAFAHFAAKAERQTTR